MIDKDAKRYNDFCHFIEGRSSFSPWLDEYDPFTEDGFAFVHAGSDDTGQFGLGDLDLYFKNKNFSYQDVLKKVQAYRDECKQSMDSDVPEEVEYVENLDELVGAIQDWCDKNESYTIYDYEDNRTENVDGEVVDGGTSGKPWLWRFNDDDWFDEPLVELNVRQVAIMAGVSDVDSVTEELCSISFLEGIDILYIMYYDNNGDSWAETYGTPTLTDEDMHNALRTMFDDAISDEDQAKLLAIAPTLVEQLDYTFPDDTVVGGTSWYSNEKDRYPRDFVWKPEQGASEANEKTLRVYFCIEGTGDDTAELAVFVDERDDRDRDKVQAYSSEEEHVSAYIDYIEDECVPMRNPEDSIVYAMLSRIYDDYDIVIVGKDSLQERGKPRKTYKRPF